MEADGRRLDADAVIWACGPWLASVFPGLVDLRVTKQDVVFYAATPDWSSPPVPGWVDYDAAIYGVGDVDGLGFKCAPDTEGPSFDADQGQRLLSEDRERQARAYLAHRFPALADAPVAGSRTCQYTLTPDTQFVIAPLADFQRRVWILGGGSGHGFKHGPALGAYVADLIEGRAEPDPRFGLGPRLPGRGLRTAGSDAGPPASRA